MTSLITACPHLTAPRRRLTRVCSGCYQPFSFLAKGDCARNILKRYWYMRPISEIGRNRLSESKVKVTLMRTRNALREYLGKEDFNV
ncbi:MAG: hypothetical protein ACLR56_09885 [Oscillospiraceae bacterium]